MSFNHDDHAPMRLPSPDDPNSGYTRRTSDGYASASAPFPGPDGTVFVPALGSYVDADIAASMGIAPSTEGTPGEPSIPHGFPEVHQEEQRSPYGEDTDIEPTDEDLDALQRQIDDANANRTTGLSDTYNSIAQDFGTDRFNGYVDTLVLNDDPIDAVMSISTEIGMDPQAVSTLVETLVDEASPIAAEHLGEDRWSSLVYAASATDDPWARRIVSDLVGGKLHPSKLPRAYALWFNNLPDATEGDAE